MRVLGLVLGIVGLITVIGGIVAVATRDTGSTSGVASTTATPTAAGAAGSETTAAAGTQPASSSEPGGGATPTSALDGIIPTQQPAVASVDVDAPALELPTFPLASVEVTYTESHTFGAITVSFRPGAYTADYAAEIARQTEAARVEANAKLGEAWNDDLTVFLADQLFAEDCLGCQGFTESDFRWIFMLDDGSVVDDEFEALLVHEMTHLIAGNTIHLPFDIFYVEGLATWVMTDDLVAYDYVSPLQSTAWVYEAGALPPLQAIMDDDFAGRMRKRVYYDAAAAFAFYVIDTYGWEQYVALYRQQPLDAVLGKPVTEVEAEWHAYLDPFRLTQVNGVGAAAWWDATSQVIDAYGRFYLDPSAYSAEQYELLTLSRLAINRADPGNALAFLAASGV